MSNSENASLKELKNAIKTEKGKENVGISISSKADFIEHRLKLWDELKNKQDQEQKALPDKPIKVTLPDGKVIDALAGKTTPLDIAKRISRGLSESAIVSKVNGNLWDLQVPLEEDCSLELLKFDSIEGKKVFWHSSAHILGQAMELKYGALLAVGPPLEDGFYYDSWCKESVSTEDFEQLESIVRSIVEEKQTFERLVVPKEIALEMFKYNPYKYQILKEKVPEGKTCTVYRCGNLIDPCKGPHIPNSARVKGFKMTKNSCAYWQGKSENALLQRIYGISFPDKKQLEEWIKFQEEAAKRDHRIIGKNQELFFFHPLTPGSCFFLPHGARIYNKLIEMLRGEYRKRGFTEVISPNVYNSDLWKISGHWENYKTNMFSFVCEEQEFALKPMNCPGHCLMFKHRMRSYRELPLRYADFGVLHRNEISGSLTGLTRVRRFQQDDAHIFCARSQIHNEIRGALEFVESVYGIFGFEFSLELSTRPEKYIGKPEVWDEAEKQLSEALNEYKEKTGKSWKLNVGDGAFYGPKIDIHISDALNRSFQCATIQLDFNLPERFDLQYMSEENEHQLLKPVMIHRAILGSVERMMAILMEHTAGKWPFWISPRQVIVLPVTEKFDDYAREVCHVIHDAGFFVDHDLSDKKLQKKIREAQLAQYNYILVVGEKEKTDRTANVRTRDNVVHGEKKLEELIADFHLLTKEYK